MSSAREVLRLVSGALQDMEPGMSRRWEWSGGEEGKTGLLDFLNAAVLAIALQRPDATARTATVLLAPGMRQTIPKGALTLIEVVRNMGADGETPGAAVSLVNPDIMLAWANPRSTSATVDNFAHDRATNPQQFYVFPAVPEDADVHVELTYSAEPKRVTEPDGEIPISAAYNQAIVHHMLASILSGDNEASNAAKAQYHMQLFNNLLGVKAQVDIAWPKATVSVRGVT